MKIAFTLIFGYLLGTLSPAALIAKIKHKNIRKSGTGNLGASNVMLNFGKGFGVFVMLFDMAKAIMAVCFASLLFPDNRLIPLLTGVAAVLGHIYPFYMKFKGGKGLASFGGLVLAYDPPVFLFLLVLGVLLMLIVNHSFVLPFSAGALFPILTGLRSGSVAVFLIAGAIGALIIAKHFCNLIKAIHGNDLKIREFIKGKWERV